MGKKGPKASNIFQNPGIKNNPGNIQDPYIKGVGSPAKYAMAAGAAAGGGAAAAGGAGAAGGGMAGMAGMAGMMSMIPGKKKKDKDGDKVTVNIENILSKDEEKPNPYYNYLDLS